MVDALNQNMQTINMVAISIWKIDIKEIIKDYFKETNSTTASFLLEYWDDLKNRFKKFVPLNVVSNSAIKL